LRSRKISEKSRFNEENAVINLQPKPVAEYTEEPPKGTTLSTDGRGCVVRFLHKRATKRHRNLILTASGGRQWSEHQMLRTKGYERASADVLSFFSSHVSNLIDLFQTSQNLTYTDCPLPAVCQVSVVTTSRTEVS
jgi:hypothetical protein